jgi:hypothetical protein
MKSSFDQRPGTPNLSHRLPARTLDIVIIVFFVLMALLAINNKDVAKWVCESLTVWMIYELVGTQFLLLWVAINEHRDPAPWNDVYRLVSTCVIYFSCALLMYLVFHLSVKTVLISAVGGIWALLNPFMRDEQPSVFQIGKEATLAVLAMIASFIGVGLFAGIAEQTISRPFNRYIFDAVTITSMGVVYYIVRWFFIARFAKTRARDPK